MMPLSIHDLVLAIERITVMNKCPTHRYTSHCRSRGSYVPIRVVSFALKGLLIAIIHLWYHLHFQNSLIYGNADLSYLRNFIV